MAKKSDPGQDGLRICGTLLGDLMKAALLLCLPAVLIAQVDQKGYRDTRWGMSLQEVEVASKDKLSLVTPPYEGGVGWILLKAPLTVAGVALTQKYVFDREGKALQEVLLVDESTSSTDANFTDLHGALTQKYGAPVTTTQDQRRRTALWRGAATTIELRLFRSLGVTVLSISYRPTSTQDADKL